MLFWSRPFLKTHSFSSEKQEFPSPYTQIIIFIFNFELRYRKKLEKNTKIQKMLTRRKRLSICGVEVLDQFFGIQKLQKPLPFARRQNFLLISWIYWHTIGFYSKGFTNRSDHGNRILKRQYNMPMYPRKTLTDSNIHSQLKWWTSLHIHRQKVLSAWLGKKLNQRVQIWIVI